MQPNYPTFQNHSDWGVLIKKTKQTLTKLYRCLIRSKFDYGCFIYGAARKSYLRELKTIHHLGLRIALGAFTTSPIESLYIEANEPHFPWEDINLHSNTILNSFHAPKILPMFASWKIKKKPFRK